MTRHGRWAAIAALPLLVAGCALNPVTGRQEFSLVSPGAEEKMGREGHVAVMAEYGAYEDSSLQRYVDGVGQKLARVSQLPDLDWHFTVIDDPTVNAFAIPGRHIYVTRGILAYLNNEAQLAGVMGHEIGHVTHRHTAEAITRQQVAGVGLLVGSVLSPAVAQYGQVASQALGLLFLGYSRENETEADELGIQYATRAGYDPREMPATYHMLGRVSDLSGARLPSFLSTHPDPGNREAHTYQLSRAAVTGRTNLTVNAGAYLQHIDGVVFGTDPRHGYFADNQYFNPDLKLQIILPPGWTYQDTRSALVATAPGERAGMQISGADSGASSPSAYVNALLARGRLSAADGGAETIGGHPAWVGRIQGKGGGSSGPLLAAFVRWSPELMLQVLGEGGGVGTSEESLIFSSMRSLKDLTDPKRLGARPDRVKVERAPAAGVFSTVVAGLGPQAIPTGQTAILNNMVTTDAIEPGRTLKIVESGKPR